MQQFEGQWCLASGKKNAGNPKSDNGRFVSVFASYQCYSTHFSPGRMNANNFVTINVGWIQLFGIVDLEMALYWLIKRYTFTLEFHLFQLELVCSKGNLLECDTTSSFWSYAVSWHIKTKQPAHCIRHHSTCYENIKMCLFHFLIHWQIKRKNRCT